MGLNGSDYGKIGFAAIAGTAACIAALAYFGGMRGRSDLFLAETYYDSAVSGLSPGGDVAFRGVKIGEVKSISFIGADYLEAAEADRQKIRIVLSLNRRLIRPRPGSTPLETLRHMIRKGVRATLHSNGITGISRIELDYPAMPVRDARISWTPEHVCIPPAPSMLESLADAATRVIGHLDRMDLAAACSNLTSAISSAASVAKSAADLLDSGAPAISGILENLEAASRRAKEFTEEIRSEPSLLLRSREHDPLPETGAR